MRRGETKAGSPTPVQIKRDRETGRQEDMIGRHGDRKTGRQGGEEREREREGEGETRDPRTEDPGP